MVNSLLSGLVGVLVNALNVIILYMGRALSALIGTLPDMPALPSPPSQVTDVEGWVAWVLPVTAIADALVFTASMYFLWWAVSIVLRWAKAERGNA